MDLISDFERSIDTLWVHHESKYDVLHDFLPAHLAMLKIKHQKDFSELIQQYFCNRKLFRAEIVDMQVSLHCNSDLQLVINENSKKRNRDSSKIEAMNYANTAEQFAANLCAFSAIEKKKQLNKHAGIYSKLFDCLEVHKCNLLESNKNLSAVINGQLHLTLNPQRLSINRGLGLTGDPLYRRNHVRMDESPSTSHANKKRRHECKEAIMNHNQAEIVMRDHDTLEAVLTDKEVEALLEWRLCSLLQGNTQASSEVINILSEERLPNVIR